MNNPGTMRTINYKFKFNDNEEKAFTINLDRETLDIIEPSRDTYPEWTKLEYQKCVNCPLSAQEHEYCPIAKKLAGTVDFFCKPIEYKNVSLTVETPERAFSKETSLKAAAVSLIGIYMATSGCPIMDKLRPMARHHLPLATTPETTYRSVSNYLIAQCLLARRGKGPDWGLKNLGKIYDAVKIVNTHFRDRLLKISSKDCALNAILTLDAYAYYINLSLIGDTFYTIETLFEEAPHGREISYTDAQENANDSENITAYKYRFAFNDTYAKEFTYHLNTENSRLIPEEKATFPSWTKLQCNKCPNCPLDEKLHSHCPAALSISNAIESLREVLPVENAQVLVETAERNFFKSTTLREGLSSMIGFLIASSGCPIFGRLKPLVRNFLPFETPQEQVYRSLGMYLLYQKFSEKGKENPDWDLTRFTESYQEINIANAAFCERLKEIPLEQNDLDILTGLPCFNQYLDFAISDKDFGGLQRLFERSYS